MNGRVAENLVALLNHPPSPSINGASSGEATTRLLRQNVEALTQLTLIGQEAEGRAREAYKFYEGLSINGLLESG